MTVLLVLRLMGASGLEVRVILLPLLARATAVPTLQTNVMAGLSPTQALTPVLLAITMTVLLALQRMGAFGLDHLVTIPRLHVLALGAQTRRINAFPPLLTTPSTLTPPTLTPILTTLAILTPILTLVLRFRTIILGVDPTLWNSCETLLMMSINVS